VAVVARSKKKVPVYGTYVGLHVPDPTDMLPESKPEWRQIPEFKLMEAVLYDAVESVLSGPSNARFKDYRAAKQWLLSTERGWLFSFENICEMLDIDASHLRRGVVAKSHVTQGQRRLAGSTRRLLPREHRVYANMISKTKLGYGSRRRKGS